MSKYHFGKEIFIFCGLIISIASCYSSSTDENQGQNQLKLNLKTNQYSMGITFEFTQGWIYSQDLEESLFLFELQSAIPPQVQPQPNQLSLDEITDFSNIYPNSTQIEVTTQLSYSERTLLISPSSPFKPNTSYVLYFHPRIHLNTDLNSKKRAVFFSWKTDHLLEGSPPFLLFDEERQDLFPSSHGDRTPLDRFYDLMNQECGCHVNQVSSDFQFVPHSSLSFIDLTQTSGFSNPEYTLIDPFVPEKSLIFLKTLDSFPLRGSSHEHDFPLSFENQAWLEYFILFFDYTH